MAYSNFHKPAPDYPIQTCERGDPFSTPRVCARHSDAGVYSWGPVSSHSYYGRAFTTLSIARHHSRKRQVPPDLSMAALLADMCDVQRLTVPTTISTERQRPPGLKRNSNSFLRYCLLINDYTCIFVLPCITILNVIFACSFYIIATIQSAHARRRRQYQQYINIRKRKPKTTQKRFTI